MSKIINKEWVQAALGSDDMELVSKLIKLNNYDINLAVSKNPNITNDIAEKLITHQSSPVWSNIIANPNTSEHVLDLILGSDYVYVMRFLNGIFSHPNMTPTLIKKYYPVFGERYPFYFLINPNTPKSIQLELLTKHRRNIELLYSIATFKGTPQNVLKAIYRLGNRDIKRKILERVDTPIELLDGLKDKYKEKVDTYIKSKGRNKDLNFKDFFSLPVKHTFNPDLELLQRLKGYLK